MHKTGGRGFLLIVCMILTGCTTTMYSPSSSIIKDNISYQLIKTSTYNSPSDGSMSLADSGTVLQKYHIKDMILGLEFDYLIYQREKNYTIYDDIQRVSNILSAHNTGIRMRERGGWEFSLIDADQLNTPHSSGCLLIDLPKNDQLHNVFSNRQYSLHTYDTSSYDLNMLNKCLGVKQDQIGIPVFISTRQTQASQMLMIYRPDGLGGAHDQSTISTLQWKQ